MGSLLALPVPIFPNYTAGDLAVRSLGIENDSTDSAAETIQSVLTAIFSVAYWDY
jgi:hypothetical protein